MSTRGTGGPLDPDRLIADFRIYDRSVDIVSIYHWLFTETRELPSTVSHFERYPRIPHADGRVATPDFSVLFTDGTGIVAEIANIARHDNSVEKLCAQLLRYDGIEALPNARGGMTAVSHVDVIFLTPIDDAEAAVRRVLAERLDDPEHGYKPAHRPVLIQFAQNSDRYVLQQWPDKSINGSLFIGDRHPNYGEFDNALKVAPDLFGPNKVRYGFMNDPVPPLYMATRRWSSVFPSAFGVGAEEITVTNQEVAETLMAQYAHGTVTDARTAMEILAAAGLVRPTTSGAWRLRRRNLRVAGADIHQAIAARLSEQKSPRRRGRAVAAQDDTGLFGADPSTWSQLTPLVQDVVSRVRDADDAPMLEIDGAGSTSESHPLADG
ncbi:hypothetical protein [Microbacterium invictum]|uniref:Uncharacterized protein n=1 Tax=Microbacterium invictum TaxID=515415 RepID=A0ABZ0VBJ7_9MICO|nr:hypothetical protein [Microbacterium invictum]WQB71005.1 hypothetical protein T9R20_03310 [Microbacterium invictum]